MNGRHQRGMAIISALLIVTVVAVIAAGLIARQGAYIRGLESEQLRIRASWMLRGGLEWSRQLLLEDSRRDPLTRLDQRWARPMRDLRLSDAKLLFNGRMEDEQGKFNLRNLLVDQRPDAQEQANFERLAGLLGVRPEDARLIVERVLASYARLPAEAPLADTRPPGFDSARETSPGAARRALAARRPPLRRFDDLARLGIPAATLERLRPYVTILPESTWVNGNTARAEVLAACVPGLGLEQARRVVGERDQGRWFLNRGDFVNRLNMPQLQAQSVKVGITSDWFLLDAYAQREQQQVRLQALLQRQAGERTTVNWLRVGP
ncbi:type II secretion system minor pseudopilin GspK [Pseudomonas aeruginosa]|nr:type II secretion system minor pseudopilin GspK [Pseudomonas aeruginosa]MBG7027780.1 type II secretion system minor pseudopilin GspK [Pseudomonas aeruginosa]MBG7372135.1 type II secretion system minor pseudopilin GspK [Pseudomonas aeruginosa]